MTTMFFRDRNVPRDLFNARHYRRVRLPLDRAETLPRWCYADPAWHAREVERIFLRLWNFVGRVDEVPNAGDFKCVDDLPGGPIVLVRGRDGRIRAFANACRHRGAKVATGKGNCRNALVCPYHAWTYGLDGRLMGAPDMERTAGFDKASASLHALNVDEWAGNLFVRFAPTGPTLVEQLGDLPQQLGPYNLADMMVTRQVDFDVGCNWKYIFENALESYHTDFVHRDSLGPQRHEDVDTRGAWHAIFLPGEKSVSVLPGEQPPFEPIAGISGRPARGTYFTAVYPCTQFACAVDSMWWLRFTPSGPETTHVNIGFCFPRASAARADFEAKAEPYYRRWMAGIPEDNLISQGQQSGAHSIGHKPGRFSWRERAVYQIANYVLDQVLDGKAKAAGSPQARKMKRPTAKARSSAKARRGAKVRRRA
jgi:phenylpropionate dioxygenase-like ring-hydroxylating dioxygenase large terminal subunit